MALDTILRGGRIYDGSGAEPFTADVGISGDRIVQIGELGDLEAGTAIDASGLAVAPGFVNVLSHAYLSMLQDRRSLSDLAQGVTTQIFGEGISMGPLTPELREWIEGMYGGAVELSWETLAEYLAHVEKSGAVHNVASYLGADNPRMSVIGSHHRPATPQELDRMQGIVREAMEEGALGIASALIYPPGSFASTEELIALCAAAAPHGGRYISHLRSEADRFVEAVEELLRISREAEVPAEIYHLKAGGSENWAKMDQVIALVEEARGRGEPITADVYPYLAGATALHSSIPPVFHDGGMDGLRSRLEDPEARAAMREAILSPDGDWENLYRLSDGADGILLLSAKEPEFTPYFGRTLADVAAERGRGDDPVGVLLDLCRQDVFVLAAYFVASEDNLRRQIALPWVSFGSDAESIAPEPPFTDEAAHPRAYGTFARILGRYVREERIIPLPEAIRRMSAFPAEVHGLRERGRVQEGWFADLVVFDPDTVIDRATYTDPHQLAVGVRDVFVNGVDVYRNGRPSGRFGGRALRG